MRWKRKIKQKEASNHKPPNVGDIKGELKFAWLPTKLNDTDYVWLEKYWIHYQWSRIFPYNRIPNELLKFYDWVLKEKTYINKTNPLAPTK